MAPKDQDKFNNWVAMWDKAQKEDADFIAKKDVNPQLESYFGMLTEGKKPNVSPKNPDEKYWNLMINLTEKYGSKDASALINDYLENKMHEDTGADFKNVAKSVASSPNKIKPDTVGNDQDLDNLVSLGATYKPEDVEELIKLKSDLNDLIVKIRQGEIEGKKVDNLEKDLQKLQDKIDELSTKMSTTVPEST